MVRRLRKEVKYFLVVIILIVIGFIGFSCYKKYVNFNRQENKKEEVIKLEKEEKEEVKQEEPKPYELIINDKGIFKDYYEKAFNKLESMSLEEKIAQIFLVRVPQYEGTDILQQYQFGGYLLFGRDVNNITKEDLISKLSGYQEVSKIPIIIAIDEEGGSISRINSNTNIVSEKFLSPRDLFNLGGLELIESDIRRKSSLLEELGINLNLAPVVDIASSESFIYDRTLGQDVNLTAEYARRVIQVSKEFKVSYALKHFPGYGDNLDTHKGLSIDNRTLQELEEKDFIPFKSGIEVGAECMLVNHNILTNIADGVPASLSKEVHDILRNKLSYTGIIITDDLYMDAIKEYQDRPSIKALIAGNDLIIITNYDQGINEIKEAINNGEIDISILDKAVLRVLAWKYYKGLLE